MSDVRTTMGERGESGRLGNLTIPPLPPHPFLTLTIPHMLGVTYTDCWYLSLYGWVTAKLELMKHRYISYRISKPR